MDSEFGRGKYPFSNVVELSFNELKSWALDPKTIWTYSQSTKRNSRKISIPTTEITKDGAFHMGHRAGIRVYISTSETLEGMLDDRSVALEQSGDITIEDTASDPEVRESKPSYTLTGSIVKGMHGKDGMALGIYFSYEFPEIAELYYKVKERIKK